jgi:hypothetical protein
MPGPNEQSAGGAAIIIGFGTIFFVLIGLVAFRPKAGIWIANAVEAEFSTAPGRPTVVGLAAEPTRRPIMPAAWGDVVTGKVDTHGLEQAQK